MPELTTAISAWRNQDPDPDTVAALDELVSRAATGEADASAELADAFSAPLAFGTAGLRGRLGPGPARMNRVVVAQAAASLAAYLIDHGHAGTTVLIGYDARHKSATFAEDTAEILAGAGLKALLCRRPLPTPVVAFGIRHFGCSAAVVVTASHNPATDNGYKVYSGDGSQIVAPIDAEIAARIAAVAARPLTEIPRSPDYAHVGDDLVDAYIARAASLVADETLTPVKWVYTALHGVGAAVMDAVVSAAGFPAPRHVDAQNEPDPDFPTLAFPNPEEPGAMDAAILRAGQSGADIAIANDPDADRCAVAVPIAGQWRMLTGDELGVLLADDLLRRGVQGTYACSVVSATLLSKVAAAYGQPHVTTLTGFKWIGRVPGLVYGYEEAIGYCTDPAAVADKDGITTAVRILALVSRLRADGLSINDRLDELARRFGVYRTSQLAFRVDAPQVIAKAMSRLRSSPPTTLAHEPVTSVDLAHGWNGLPPTDGVAFIGCHVRAVVRPSGTEPKLKCYLQVHTEPTNDLVTAHTNAAARLTELAVDVTTALGW